MSAIQQNMIAGAATVRTSAPTATRKLAGNRRARPGRWINWHPGDPASAKPTFRVVLDRLRHATLLESGDRVLNIAAGGTSTLHPRPAPLPFGDGAFDVVLVGLGAVCPADLDEMAQELVRVCRRGGRIGLACWTQDGFDGQLISIINRYAPKSGTSDNPVGWGTREHLDALFGRSADALGAVDRTHVWRCASPAAWLEASRAPGAGLHDLYRAVDPDWHDQLSAELLALVDRFNEVEDGSMLVNSDYLEFVVHKSIWRT